MSKLPSLLWLFSSKLKSILWRTEVFFITWKRDVEIHSLSYAFFEKAVWWHQVEEKSFLSICQGCINHPLSGQSNPTVLLNKHGIIASPNWTLTRLVKWEHRYLSWLKFRMWWGIHILPEVLALAVQTLIRPMKIRVSSRITTRLNCSNLPQN